MDEKNIEEIILESMAISFLTILFLYLFAYFLPDPFHCGPCLIKYCLAKNPNWINIINDYYGYVELIKNYDILIKSLNKTETNQVYGEASISTNKGKEKNRIT